MELKSGYKQSVVGIIPEDWKVEELRNNLLRSPQYGINAPAVKYSENLPTYIRITDITEDGNFSPENLVSVNCSNSDRFVLQEGDIVFARTGASVGKSYLYRREDGPLVFAGFLIRITPNASKLFPVYFSHYVKTGNYWNWVTFMSMRSGQPGINGKEYAQLLIPVPPTINEQRAIAAALSDVDALLASLDALIAKKRLILQGAMQELLTGKRRLPGFSGEWEVCKLGEVTQIVNGGTPSTRVTEYWNGNIDWCTPTDITRTPGKYLLETEKQISENGLKNCSARMLPKGALLLCSRATIGEVRIATKGICTNQGFKSLICSARVQNEYLYYLLLTLKPLMLEKAIGSTFLEISKRDTASLDMLLPSFIEQEAIASVLSDMDTELHVLEQQREKTYQIKQGMMQELLTGRTRLV